MRMFMIVAVAGLATAGCTASVDAGVDTAVPEPPPGVVEGPDPGAPPPADVGAPPDMEVTAGETAVDLTPFTYCWSTDQAGVCADGIPQPERVVVAVPDVFVVAFVDGELTAEAGPLGGQRDPLTATRTGPGHWQVDVADLPAGDHVVTLAWNGDEGDAHAAFTVRRPS